MNNDLVAYYAERAKEYEKIYDKPERQGDLKALSNLVQTIFAAKDVFEIACGTGYWTQHIAKTADSVLATDINQAVIDIAETKAYEKNNVTFEVADIYKYRGQQFSSLFGGFIWSHIKIQEVSDFIETVHRFVKPGGLVVFADNNYVEDSSRPISYTDEYGNAYQERELENGNKYSVIKNFPSESLFFKLLKERAEGIKYISLKYYWIVCYNRK
ncbi:MAG TPA: class I SAM-dependent methyltransferase [Bacteroidia bacterium]|jgi:ubiquinone/menaquinone biosynthesis C-methylase UbiE|nr:class I SAM-dependent methyltransferase [Bacteroidia bacterium]